MVNLQQLQRSLHSYFKYLAHNPDVSIEVRYKGKAYQLHLDKLDKDVPARLNKTEKPVVETGSCALCGRLAVQGVCLSKCEGKKPPHKP